MIDKRSVGLRVFPFKVAPFPKTTQFGNVHNGPGLISIQKLYVSELYNFHILLGQLPSTHFTFLAKWSPSKPTFLPQILQRPPHPHISRDTSRQQLSRKFSGFCKRSHLGEACPLSSPKQSAGSSSLPNPPPGSPASCWLVSPPPSPCCSSSPSSLSWLSPPSCFSPPPSPWPWWMWSCSGSDSPRSPTPPRREDTTRQTGCLQGLNKFQFIWLIF